MTRIVGRTFVGHRGVKKHDGSQDGDWFAYQCGYCGRHVSGAKVASYYVDSGQHVAWLMCPTCCDGSVLSIKGDVHPGVPFGPTLEGLPEEPLGRAYDEARRCMQVAGYTAAELVCRNILMYIAVEKGAKENQKFAKYLSYLVENGYVTPPMMGWVTLIKSHGNKAAHELEPPSKERAESTVMFTAELLRLTYEMDYMAKKYATPERPEEDETGGAGGPGHPF